MALSWPFSRRRRETAAPGPAAEPAAGPAPSSAGVQRAPGDLRRFDWASLPPIQRASTDIELTAETGLFIDNLTGHSPVETSLQPLGHDVSIEAPAGIASGIAHSIQHRSSSAPLEHRLRPAPPAPAARAQRAPLGSVHPPSAPAPEPAPFVAVAREEHEEEAATMPAVPVSSESADAPVQRAPEAPSPAPVVPRPPVQRAPDAPLVFGQFPVARHETGSPHEDEVATSPAPESVSEPVQRAPEADQAPGPAAPVQRAAEPEESESGGHEAEEVAATMPEAGVQRAAEEPEESESGGHEAEEAAATVPEGGVQRAPEGAPTVGARPVVATTLFRSSLSPIAPKIGLEGGGDLQFAAQRSPAEAGASAPAAGTIPPGARPAAPGAGDIGAVQRAAERALGQSTPLPGTLSEMAQRSAQPGAPFQRLASDSPFVRPSSGEGVQRAPSGPTLPPSTRSAPLGGPRRPGLGAPLAPEGVQRSPAAAQPPAPTPPPSERTFRRTRSSLAAQRAADGGAPPMGLGAPQSAPIAGEKPPLTESQPGPASAQRSPADMPDTPLPLAQTPGAQRADDPAPPFAGFDAQRAPDDARPPVPFDVQRAPESGAGDGFDAFAAHASELAAGRTPEGHDPGLFGPVQLAPETVDFPAEVGPLAPRLDLPHRKRGGASSRSADAPASGTAPAAAVQRSAGPAPVAVLPLVGRRPLQVQRSSEDVPAPIRAGVEQQLSTPLEGVKVHRSPETGSAAKQLKARAFTTGGEIHLPAEQGPLDREPARSLVAHELVHVAQQRQLGASLPSEESHHGRELEAQAQRMEVATQRAETVAQRSPAEQLVLARKADPVTSAIGSAREAAARMASGAYTMTATAPQLAPEQNTQPTTSFASPVQREVVINEISSNVNNSNSNSGSGGGGNSGADGSRYDPISGEVPHTNAAGSPLESSQLEQVWTFVRSRLTDELQTDRARAGLTIDLF